MEGCNKVSRGPFQTQFLWSYGSSSKGREKKWGQSYKGPLLHRSCFKFHLAVEILKWPLVCACGLSSHAAQAIALLHLSVQGVAVHLLAKVTNSHTQTSLHVLKKSGAPTEITTFKLRTGGTAVDGSATSCNKGNWKKTKPHLEYRNTSDFSRDHY